MCVCVVSNGHGGLDGGRDGGGGWYACGDKAAGLVACREMSKYFPTMRGEYTDYT